MSVHAASAVVGAVTVVASAGFPLSDVQVLQTEAADLKYVALQLKHSLAASPKQTLQEGSQLRVQAAALAAAATTAVSLDFPLPGRQVEHLPEPAHQYPELQFKQSESAVPTQVAQVESQVIVQTAAPSALTAG